VTSGPRLRRHGEARPPPGGDCNDGDLNINPGAAEICDDGIDNDRRRRQRGAHHVLDADDDGMPRPAPLHRASARSVSPERGRLPDQRTNRTPRRAPMQRRERRSTGITETRQSPAVDNNCNGNTTRIVTCYRDADGDTMNDDDDPGVPCGAGYAARGGDRDDTRATVPRAGEASTCNGRDDDCDGSVDEGVTQSVGGYRDTTTMAMEPDRTSHHPCGGRTPTSEWPATAATAIDVYPAVAELLMSAAEQLRRPTTAMASTRRRASVNPVRSAISAAQADMNAIPRSSRVWDYCNGCQLG
jgi:hypothetical protein